MNDYALIASASVLLLCFLRLSFNFSSGGFHRQFEATSIVCFQNFHFHLLTFFKVISNCVHALIGDLADVQQTIFTWHDLDDSAEIQQLQNGTFVDLADFNFSCQFLNATLGFLAGGGVDGQVLVFHDLLGIREGLGARFAKRYANILDEMVDGVSAFAEDVRDRSFPGPEHGYSIDHDELTVFRSES